tara:strand:- start:242 stop:1054 length:813 start_codon:yes stop_codon:yes gene_type:complete
MKTLIAGPWVGEFGWELFAWQAYVRSLSENFDQTIIIARENSKAIYDDFADHFYTYQPSGGLPDAFFMHNLDTAKAFKEAVKTNDIKLQKGTSVLVPRRIGIPPHTHYTQHVILGEHVVQPKYICFGESDKPSYDYVFHMRSRDLRKEDNWSVENWTKLAELLGGNIACIGTVEESLCLEGTTDLRGLPLESLFGVMKNAGCVMGPSSGPMHLAALCNSPHVVWSIPQNRVRYEENWNPHKAPVLFMDEYNWHPTPQYVYERYLQWRKDD